MSVSPFRRRFCVLIFFAVILFFIIFCASCGLDIYYYLETPVLLSTPGDNNNPLERVFQFQTNDAGNSAPAIYDIFKGTAVFYKIYNSTNRLASDNASVSARNSQYSSDGVQALQSLGYMQLMSTDRQVPLIVKTGVNRTVRIRLFKEGDSSNPFMPGILVGPSDAFIGIPLRAVGNSWDFAFFDDTDGHQPRLPQRGDLDVTFTETEGTNIWYVNAYAVSNGMNTYFSPVYSSVIHLGWIKIEK